jgi:hypothetical protein
MQSSWQKKEMATMPAFIFVVNFRNLAEIFLQKMKIKKPKNN